MLQAASARQIFSSIKSFLMFLQRFVFSCALIHSSNKPFSYSLSQPKKKQSKIARKQSRLAVWNCARVMKPLPDCIYPNNQLNACRWPCLITFSWLRVVAVTQVSSIHGAPDLQHVGGVFQINAWHTSSRERGDFVLIEVPLLPREN